MGLNEVLQLAGITPYKIDIGDDLDKVIKVLGDPNGDFTQKKYGIRILKYEDIELTFIREKLKSYSYLISGIKSKTFISNTKLQDEVLEITNREKDYHSISYSSGFDLVFSVKDNMLFKIIVNK